MAAASSRRLMMLQEENDKLHEKLMQLRLVSRAKCLLIETCGMTEAEAHHYIEKRSHEQPPHPRTGGGGNLGGGRARRLTGAALFCFSQAGWPVWKSRRAAPRRWICSGAPGLEKIGLEVCQK